MELSWTLRIIIGLVLLIIGILTSYSINTYNKFQYYLIMINKAEVNITNALKKKYDILVRYVKYLIENSKLKELDYEEFLDIDVEKTNEIELDNLIIKYENDIKTFLDNHEKVLKDNTVKEIIKELQEVNVIVNGSKKYYNNIIVKYNLKVKKFPSKIIANIYKYNVKDSFAEEKIEHFKILDE